MRPTHIAIDDQLWLGGAYFQVQEGSSHSVPATGDDGDLAVPEGTLPMEPLPEQFSLQHLTPAESAVVLWLSRGCTTDEEIAKQLHRSPHTVRTHVTNIFAKLGLSSRTELVGWLRRVGK